MTYMPKTLLLAGIICTLLCTFAHARTADHSTYCSGMYYCLQETVKGCSAEDYTSGDIPKTDTYCSIFKDLQARGLRSTSTQGRQIYQKVSGKHHVEYTLEGTLPMPAEVMTHLMNNLPFAAQLVNAYQGTNFQAAYLDKTKKRFSGSGESLSGIFNTVLQNAGQTRSLYHGFGTTEVLVWRLSGTALVMFDFEEVGPQKLTYRVRCIVFPHNVFVKSILNFFLFRNAIVDVLDETFGDIQDSAMAFHRGEHAPIENYPAFSTPEGRQQIEEFRLLLQRTMGGAATAPPLPTADTAEAAQEPDDALQ
jgi:hypothetical protein